MYLRKNDRWKYLAAVLLSVILLMAGCGRQPAAPAAEQASEDTTEAASKADTEQAAVAEEPEKITVENALVGLCFARSETGDNEYLFRSLQDELVQRGFSEENITAQELTGRSSRQQEEIDECLAKGCSLLIIAAVDDKEIPAMADKIEAAGAGAIFVNCTPGDDEILRWTEQDIHAVWIGSTYAQELAIQMNILYDCSGTERGIDFNGDGRVGTLLVGGGEEARTVLEETLRDLGSELYVLGETDSRDPEEISSYTQEILNTHKKEAELILCSSESSAQAASDGVQLRHRLVGRDFYEQSKLTAVAAKDMVEGNQAKKTIADVIFKVTEENAQEVLDQLWKTRNEEDNETAGTNGTGEEESADPDEDSADSESTADS